MENLQLLRSKESKIKNRVIYLSEPEKFEKQERLYVEVRKKEGRLYSDEVLKTLPDLDSDHPLYHEWQIRKKSFQRFVSYLRKRKGRLRILDLGCGNGWMSNQIANRLKSEVFALDLNVLELQQGARVFAGNPRLKFYYGNILEDIFPKEYFDIVLLASSIQYFPDIEKLLKRLTELLKDEGEIHIFDSPLYERNNVSSAMERTKIYYERLGLPQMTTFYHHHSLCKLESFYRQVRYDPNSFIQRLIRRLINRYSSPFPWIQINKKSNIG